LFEIAPTGQAASHFLQKMQCREAIRIPSSEYSWIIFKRAFWGLKAFSWTAEQANWQS
jgi:hypothetical protein